VFGNQRIINIEFVLHGNSTTRSASRDTIAGKFDLTDNSATEKTLIAQDTEDSNKQYQLDGVSLGFDWALPKITAGVAVADPKWKSVTQNSTTWTNPGDGGTLAITPGGNVETLPTIELTPTGARGGDGQLYKRFVKLINPNTFPLGEHGWNLANSEAANGLDTGALVAAGKMQADGDDLQVFIDGQSSNRWLQDMNTTSTEIWSRVSLAGGKTFTLGENISSVGAVTTLQFQDTPTNKNRLSKQKSSSQVLIGSEYYTYTGINTAERKLTGVTRAVFGSSAASHAIADTVTWIEHQIFITYGDATATDPNSEDADDLKPMFLLTSENDRLDFDEFQTDAGSRIDEWINSISVRRPIGRTILSGPTEMTLYTGVHNSTSNLPQWADPATYMGAAVQTVLDGDEYLRTGGDLWWQFSHPCKIDQVTMTGEKFNTSSGDWLGRVRLLYSDDGENWNIKFTEDAPTTTTTWESIDNTAAQALGGSYRHVALLAGGGQAGGSTQHRALVEYSDAEISLDSTLVPTVAIGAEQGSQYEFKSNLQNTFTGDTIFINGLTIDTNDTVIIDSENRDAYLSSDNTKVREYLDFDTIRTKWITLSAGTANTLQFNDTGTGNVTIVVKYNDRNN
jgi:hypothetical protein